MIGARNGYFADFGRTEDLRKAITDGFVYDGRRSIYRQRRHGASSASNPGRQFVVFNQNHDQIANADAGRRFSELLTLGQQKLAAAILICAPDLPMLFMGEEFGASSPFNYFTSFADPAWPARSPRDAGANTNPSSETGRFPTRKRSILSPARSWIGRRPRARRIGGCSRSIVHSSRSAKRIVAYPTAART